MKATLSLVHVGDTFKVGELEFVVLEHTKNGTRAITKNIWTNAAIGYSSNGREALEDRIDVVFKSEFELEDNIIGKVKLLTLDQFLKYAKALEEYKTENWWWLADAYKPEEYTSLMCCVNENNRPTFDMSVNVANGIRPTMVLESSVTVSI